MNLFFTKTPSNRNIQNNEIYNQYLKDENTQLHTELRIACNANEELQQELKRIADELAEAKKNISDKDLIISELSTKHTSLYPFDIPLEYILLLLIIIILYICL